MSLHFSQKMTVHLRKIGFTVLITLLSAGAIPFAANLRVIFSTPLVLAQTPDAREAEADRLLQQGIEQAKTSQFEAALQSWQQALAIYKEIGNQRGEARALLLMGGAYAVLRDLPHAIEFLEQGVTIAHSINDPQLEKLGQQALSQLQGQNNPRKVEADRLLQQGIEQFQTSQFEAALQSWQQALTIYREIKDRKVEGNALGNLGEAYRNLGDYPKAIEYYQQSLAISREIKDRQGEGTLLGNLGNAYYSLGDYPKAIEYQQQSLAILREIKDRLGEGKSLNNLGFTLFKSGNLAAAETTLNNAIEVYESLRGGLNDAQKVSIFEDQSRSYRTLQQVLIAQNKTDTALEIAERGRARAFVELLAKKLTSNPQETLPTASLKPTITQLKKIAQQQKSTLVQYSIIYDDFQIQGKQQWKQSELYIWVIKPTGEVTFRRSDLKPLWQKQNTTLADLVTTSRESIGVRGRGLFVSARVEGVNQTEKLQQLHQLLIQPIADLLPTDPNARVTFVPQDELFLVPFVALLDAQGKYLIEKHTILTAPSIQVLDLTHQQRQLVSGKDILIVGNPNMPSIAPKFGETPQKLPSLPGSEAEAKTIAQLFNTQALTGNDATKLAILQLLPKARIIHLATHGLLDDFTGLGIPGAVALAPSGNDNGLLTSSEILDLKLHAELVVLSACDTGRGKLTGDGVIGLSRSLISAGVPSVIVSLWSVPDAPTAALMAEFYQNLQKMPDKAQALRQAMLKVMKSNPEPKNWAAFTLIGEAE
ncbi:CHAT domain-containing protein [Argonema galeatum]|uniref:CHAT domain-containing protein n=1 Tax=Argonema galeatum TaxID=2942762 RepID=UPI002013B7D7|nr:CHAT domain-containing tetratricopeptide repeat protein [Argonema galeatum]MCL1467825.1 CHAT domain-containing protein [Argonema galeatum A003/A1]